MITKILFVLLLKITLSQWNQLGFGALSDFRMKNSSCFPSYWNNSLKYGESQTTWLGSPGVLTVDQKNCNIFTVLKVDETVQQELLVKIDAKTGKEIGTFNFGEKELGGNPVISSNGHYLMQEKFFDDYYHYGVKLFYVDEQMKEKVFHRLQGGYYTSFSSAIVNINNREIFITAVNHHEEPLLLGFDIKDNYKLIWQTQVYLSFNQRTLTVDDQYVYFINHTEYKSETTKKIVKIDAFTGNIVNSIEVAPNFERRRIGKPIIFGNKLFALDKFLKKLFVIDKNTFKLIKELDIPSINIEHCVEPVGYADGKTNSMFIQCANPYDGYTKYLKIDVDQIEVVGNENIPDLNLRDSFTTAVTKDGKLVTFGKKGTEQKDFYMVVVDGEKLILKRKEEIVGDLDITFVVDDSNNVLYCSNFVDIAQRQLYVRCFTKSL